MGLAKQIDVKNRTYEFYIDIIDLKNFDRRLSKIDKNSYKNIGIYNNWYIRTKKKWWLRTYLQCKSFVFAYWSSNGHIQEKGVNKYLIFDSSEENKVLLKKCNGICNGIKNKIKEVSSGEWDYEKYYMKIKFNSDDNLPLKKPLNFRNRTIIIRSVFREDGKVYPQVFLDDALYELNV